VTRLGEFWPGATRLGELSPIVLLFTLGSSRYN
jgi:hypothetical protein